MYDQGLYLQAWQAGSALGPLSQWPGVEGRILAARLGQHLGAHRLSAWLCRCAYRENPTHPDATYYYGFARLRRRGPYFAWRWWSDQTPIAEPIDSKASWLALGSEITASLRDFETAERLLHEALQIDPDSAWLRVVQAGVLQAQDRYDEALNTAHEALHLRPWYRPAVQQVGHLLTLRDRDGEALEFLATASDHVECSAVTIQLFGLQMELKQYAEARRTLDRAEKLMPLADKHVRNWLSAQRSELAYYLGDFDACIQFAEGSDSEFHKAIAERLKDEGHRRAPAVTLPVGFVRQHHKTCGPATLAAITRYWQMPADHLEVADEICYDGTSNYSERKWAQDQGWICREFSVTEEATRSLIDRGVPFTFTTVDPGSAHLQAVIGYDARRGTIVIRDPYWRSSPEGLADKVLQCYRRFGPRGLALVPASHQDKLEGLELPDEDLWNLLFELDDALESHQRERAGLAVERLEALAPGHRLALEGRRRLAIYDGNPSVHLAVVEQLLAEFPACETSQLERLSLLQSHVRREDRLAIYREMCAKKETPPVFWQRYAHELREDVRHRDKALWLLRRAIRRWPSDGVGYYLLANVYCDMRRFQEALELYRFALCLNDRDEQFAMAYFSAARWFKQGESVLELLRYRFNQLGRKSSFPARTLAMALFQIDRDEEALEVIEEAIRLRPDDGGLLLYAADAQSQAGVQRAHRSHELLEQARDKAPRTDWLDSAAQLADQEGRLHDALALWRELSDLQPLNVAAHRSIARLLAATQGRPAALQYLRAAVDQFPHNLPLFEILVEWLRDEPNQVREPVLRSGLEQFADNAWLHRELAFLLIWEGRFDEARQLAQTAGELDPLHPSWHYLQADLLQHEGRHTEVQAVLRAVVELSIDNDYGISRLIDSCQSLQERREAVVFLREQLIKQVICGDGLLAFREHARSTLGSEELLSVLRQALAERPDLWHAWSACVQQLLAQDQAYEAWELCQQANQRFPLVPRLWLDRSQVAHARLDESSEEAALRSALQISPSWNLAVRSLADLLERTHRTDEAERLLQHAAARNPLDPLLQQLLAETLWRLDRREEAVPFALRAVRLEPGYDRAWDALHYWGGQLGQPELALSAARELSSERGGEARTWLLLARLLDQDEQRDEHYASLEQALALNPLCIEAYDQKAMSLARQQKYDDALAVCNAQVWRGHPPSELQARAAWIEAERGDLTAAIKLMQAVVADDPGFYGAWSKLADWCQVAGDYDGYLHASEALVRLNPHYEVSLGYLGDARLHKGDKAGAREALQRAFELNPRYEFAGNLLFDLHFEAEEFEQAAMFNARVREHSESSDSYARQAQLAGKRREPQPVLEAWRKVVLDPEASPWAVMTTRDAVYASNCSQDAEQFVREAFRSERVHPRAARCWIELRVARNRWPTPEELRELMPLGEVGERAVYAYVDEIETHGELGRLFDLKRFHSTWLRENTMCWAAVGRGFCAFSEYQPAWEWMHDWQDRPDLQPWMLLNVAEALRGVGRLTEAVACSQRALELPEPHARHFHNLFLACDAAVAGQLETAREQLQAFEQGNASAELDPDRKLLHCMVVAVLAMADAAPADRPRLFGEERRRLAHTRQEFTSFEKEPERKRLYRATLQQLASLRGGLMGRLWNWWLRIS